MKSKNFLLFILLASSLQLSAQFQEDCPNHYATFFFNLPVDSCNDTISNEIVKIKDYVFSNTIGIDTFGDRNGHFITYKKINPSGFEDYKSSFPNLDFFKPDSLSIFLGGGSGAMLASANDTSNKNIYFDIKTVEIIRDFRDSATAFEAFNKIKRLLNESCEGNCCFKDIIKLDDIYRSSIRLKVPELEKDKFLYKNLELKFYPPRASSNSYTINLSYSKSIFREMD